MPSNDQQITGRQCQEWRLSYRDGSTPYELAVEAGVPRAVVRNHLTGECSHGGEEPPISSGRAHEVSTDECRDIRDRYDDGQSIERLQESTGRRWRTLVRHLTGDCPHDAAVEGPTVEKREILRRDHVTAEECVQLRRGVREANSVMAYADTVDHEYQVVLAHVNGECAHDVGVPPRDPNDRSEDITPADCREIRREYRSDPGVEFSDLAEERGCSPTTIERHVTFRCSHPPDDALVTDVDAVQDLLEPGAEADEGLSRVTSEDIVRLDAIKNADRKEPAQDLAAPDPDRVTTTRSRVVRNTDLAHDVKQMYDHECQICGTAREGPNGQSYAEAHHIRPLGRPHDGPDEPENILVLCPNHHADFDYGRLAIDPETYRVSHAYDEDVDGTELYVADPHDPSETHLAYHNEVIAGEF